MLEPKNSEYKWKQLSEEEKYNMRIEARDKMHGVKS